MSEHEATATEVMLLKKKVEDMDRLAGVYAQLLMDYDQMNRLCFILTGGIMEITQIKGSPPIQVARTIANRTLDACQKHIAELTANEPTDTDQDIPEPGASQRIEECQAGDISNPADRPNPASN